MIELDADWHPSRAKAAFTAAGLLERVGGRTLPDQPVLDLYVS